MLPSPQMGELQMNKLGYQLIMLAMLVVTGYVVGGVLALSWATAQTIASVFA